MASASALDLVGHWTGAAALTFHYGSTGDPDETLSCQVYDVVIRGPVNGEYAFTASCFDQTTDRRAWIFEQKGFVRECEEGLCSHFHTGESGRYGSTRIRARDRQVAFELLRADEDQDGYSIEASALDRAP